MTTTPALVESTRLHESDQQLKVLQEGFVEMTGDVLWLFSWFDLESAVCGAPTIDIDAVNTFSTNVESANNK